MIRFGTSMATVLLLAAATSIAQPVPDPFERLRVAYAARDANLAASAYAEDAVYAELYPGSPPNLLEGRESIRAHFAAFLGSLPVDGPVDLNFRLIDRTGAQATGYYRLRYGSSDAPRTLYGRFATGIGPEGFRLDVSSTATVAEFEDGRGGVMFAADDEILDPDYYGPLSGSWMTGDGCRLTVTRSTRRLYALDSCTHQWRGLERVSGREWTSGARVIDSANVNRRYVFAANGGLSIDGVAAQPLAAWRRQAVAFAGPVGRLAGTIYVPLATGPARRPAIVLVHGSGPQDRDGYASIIATLATQLAENGLIVLTFDKRGVGGSQGDWASAGFDALAADTAAAMQHLSTRSDVDPARIGIGGSSQAGWVAARAVADGAQPAFIMLVGAAGAAMTVEQQNLYNTEVRMRCAGIAEPDIALALDQQRAFFAARRDPARARALSSVSRRAADRPAIADWLFPAQVVGGGSPQWYDILDPDFDPLPVWRNYRGRLFLLFGEHDDSTPTRLAVERLGSTGTITVLSGTQHLGLATGDLCSGELDRVDRFAADFWPTIARWSQAVTAE